MTRSTITNAFSPWLAERLAQNLPARPDKMVFAEILGQNATAEVDPNEGMPAAGRIKHVAEIAHYGTLNERAFVCSVVLDTTLGDWSYNWIGLIDSASDTVLMIVHIPAQQKIKTQQGRQGNTLTRNLMMEFSGAAEAAQITVTAETWQIDYSARLRSMDESRRLAIQDYYGPAAFLNEGFQVVRVGAGLAVRQGLGYVAGLRVVLDADRVLPAAGNTGIWVDAVWSGTVLGRWAHTFTILTGEGLTDYVDAAGFPHFVTKIATVSGQSIDDLRQPFPLQRLEDVVDGMDSYSREEADNRFLQKTQNLEDVPDKEAARDNLDVHSREEADNRYLQQAQNLEDIPDKEAARENLDVHSREEADNRYLQQDQNLGDIQDKAIARENLGLRGPNGEGFRAIVDAVLWVGITIQSDSNPAQRFDWQRWQSLSALYDGKVIRIAGESGHTGGDNSVTIVADNLPDHFHKAGMRAPGDEWQRDQVSSGTDNQRGQPQQMTGGTFTDQAGTQAVRNTPLDVTNEYVTVAMWKRIA